MIDILIPSYHRPKNLKTIKYFMKLGYAPENLHVIIDNEGGDEKEYQEEAERNKFNLHVFDINEARKKYDFVHRRSVSRRAVGIARNSFYDYAKMKGIEFYCVIDDDTTNYQVRPFQRYIKSASLNDIVNVFEGIKKFMQTRRIGCFGLSQTGDCFEKIRKSILRYKVMNTTFYNTKYIFWGERGAQDEDTSQFASILNEGYFTGSLSSGLVLSQVPSGVGKGGLTDLYNECKLLNKSLVTVIQFPSAIRAERQVKNGNRLHHRINYRYLMPRIIKGKRNNIAWDAYPEDAPFSNLFPRKIK